MALIGISGKIHSGKDTVGKIIQYLLYTKSIDSKNEVSFIIDCLDDKNISLEILAQHSGWEIKRFAGKVKEICSILTGIPVADFEKQEVKDRLLGKEWDKIEQLYDHNYNLLGKRAIKALTVRELLQKVGTDAMRNVIHENIWVNALMSQYKPIDKRTIQDPDDSNINYPNWIITDTRFPNEAEAIKGRGGLLIRVVSDIPCPHCGERENIHANVDYSSKVYKVNDWLCNECGTTFERSNHESETALDNYSGFNETIINDGTIEELIEGVKLILIKHKII